MVLPSQDEALSVKHTGYISICTHVDGYTISGYEELIGCKLNHGHRYRGCPSCHRMLKCVHYNIEFEIEIARLEGFHKALVITKWLNFGLGQTPLDSKWHQHLQSRSEVLEMLVDSEIERADFNHGLRAVSEVQGSKSSTVLMQRFCLIVDCWGVLEGE